MAGFQGVDARLWRHGIDTLLKASSESKEFAAIRAARVWLRSFIRLRVRMGLMPGNGVVDYVKSRSSERGNHVSNVYGNLFVAARLHRGAGFGPASQTGTRCDQRPKGRCAALKGRQQPRDRRAAQASHPEARGAAEGAGPGQGVLARGASRHEAGGVLARGAA